MPPPTRSTARILGRVRTFLVNRRSAEGYDNTQLLVLLRHSSGDDASNGGPYADNEGRGARRIAVLHAVLSIQLAAELAAGLPRPVEAKLPRAQAGAGRRAGAQELDREAEGGQLFQGLYGAVDNLDPAGPGDSRLAKSQFGPGCAPGQIRLTI